MRKGGVYVLLFLVASLMLIQHSVFAKGKGKKQKQTASTVNNPNKPDDFDYRLTDLDPKIPEEHQVIWLDADSYDKLIADPTWGTPLNGKTPWVILFIKKAQVDQNSFKKLRKIALKYKGTIRFSWANQNEELLAATFDARYRPETFLIKDGRVYRYPDADYPHF